MCLLLKKQCETIPPPLKSLLCLAFIGVTLPPLIRDNESQGSQLTLVFSSYFNQVGLQLCCLVQYISWKVSQAESLGTSSWSNQRLAGA